MSPRLLIRFLHPVMVGIVFQFLPLLTRRGIFFSATVDPDFPRSPAGRRVLASFRVQSALWTVLACLLAPVLPATHFVVADLVPVMLLIAACLVSYWLKFREVHTRYGTRTTELRAASLSPSAAEEGLRPWISLPPFIALAALGLYLHLHWNLLPEHYPVHFGANGEPNRWATRGWTSVYVPLLIGAGMNLLVLCFAWTISRLSRKTVMRYVTVRSLQLLLYPLTFTLMIVSLLPLWHPPRWLVPVVMLASVTGLIYWGYKKISSPMAADASPEPRNDNYWKAGMFYYNPDDPAILVSKRVGIGYTLNFASAWTWVIMIILLVLPLLPVFLIHPR